MTGRAIGGSPTTTEVLRARARIHVYEVGPLNEQEQGQKNLDGSRNGRRRRRRRAQGAANPAEQAAPRPNPEGAPGTGRRRRRRRRAGGEGGNAGGFRRPRIDPFELFAAYHLGLGENKRFRPVGIHEISKRFNCHQNDILHLLTLYSMDNKALDRLRGRFEVGWARQDIKAAPEGVDKEEIARDRYRDFLECAVEVGLFTEAPSLALLQQEEHDDDDDDLDDDDDDHDDDHDGDDDGDDDDED
jgi:hypothetical protein